MDKNGYNPCCDGVPGGGNSKGFIKIRQYFAEILKNENQLPSKIRIDASTICQLHCPSCYMRQNPYEVKNGCGIGYLKFENFKTFIDLNPNIKEIELSNSGEIFLNPDLVKIIKYSYLKHIKLTARNGVNLNYLTEEQAEALVKYKFDSITVSLDGASQETYEKYRIGGNYETVINNIKKIIYYKNKYDSGYPFIIWKYIVFGHNEKDIINAKKQFEELKKETNDITLEFSVSCKNDFPIIDVDFVKNETGLQNLNIFLSPIEQLKDYNDKKIIWFPCMYLWDSPQINWDGQFLGCCCNFTDFFIKDVFNSKLIDILNDPIILYAKNMIQGFLPPKKDIPCYSCYIYDAMAKTNIWFKR